MTPDTHDAPSLMGALRFYLREHAKAASAARKRLRLNELDAKAIAFVAANPGSRPSDIRDHLLVTSAGVTALVDRLVQRDIFRRELDTSDRRVNRIHLIVNLDEAPWCELEQFDTSCSEATRDLDERTQRSLAEVLTRMVLHARR
jgi:DNA-binding MarR family transcriptional regulator